MTLSINKTFVWEGITVKIALPQDYDKSRPYPAILLNDGLINYLSRLSSSVILIGLISNNRLDDYTPWKANALKPGNPDFGGRADSYHQKLFNGILAEIRQHCLLDDKRIAYGGYSLGGLAAVYSLYSVCESSLCFFYLRFFLVPRFSDYCRTQDLKNKDCLVYLQNGKTEGANHSNRLSKAPFYAAEIHRLIQKEILTTCSAFDPYGHHEALKERYAAFAEWLTTQWHID